MEFRINKYHFLYIVGILSLCIYMLLIINGQNLSDTDILLNKTSVIGLIEIAFCLIIWKLYTGTVFSLFVFYLLSFYVFTMGQSVLRLFNVEYTFTNIYNYVSADAMVNTHVFTILCIAFLFEGALIAVGRKEGNNECERRQWDSISYDSALFGQVGLLLFLASVIPMMIYLGNLVTAYSMGGYSYAFESVSESSGIMRIVSKVYPFCIPSLVMIIIGYSDGRRTFAKVVMVGIGIIYFFIGERTGAASIFLSLFLLNSQLKERENESAEKVGKIKIVLLVIALAVFIPALGELRNTSDMSLSALALSVKENGLLSSISDTIATMGYSEFPLGKTMEIVPNEKSYAFGQSYFYAFLAIFPNIFGGTHVAVKYAGLAQWLMDYLGMKYGPGYSYPAEAWYNFGWFGCIVLFFIGYFFAKCMYIPKGAKVSNVTLFISVVFFLETITSPRRELMTVVRLVGYYVFIPIIVMYFLNSRINSKKTVLCKDIDNNE